MSISDTLIVGLTVNLCIYALVMRTGRVSEKPAQGVVYYVCSIDQQR